ncbi:hypothetical protein DFS33DRAFT_1261247 [Desarmillaria ectypa]|nr:hypothetical protein DFS33DRAFT_1261247 [Desarmillaria ectypa]
MPNTSRVWFITGTSSGLGKATVEAVLAAEERVVATARKPEVLDYLKDKFLSTKLLVLPLDVTNETQIKSAFERTIKQFDRMDVVVNNAGYVVFGEIEGIPDEDARKQFEVQFWGTVHIMKEAVKNFRKVNPKGKGGRIFNVNSIGGYMANPTLAYYSSSKFGNAGSFTESFLKEMNIKGTIIEPGGFDSEWKGTSAYHIPPHPAYTDDTNTCSTDREEMNGEDYVKGLIASGNFNRLKD